MAERRTQIQVPERRDDEAPAAPQQLERIRQLVAGMSLQGYRFDYRKMGADQADAVIEQLTEMRREQGPPQPTRSKGPGCAASLARGVTTIVFFLVIAAIAGGGLYYVFIVKDGNFDELFAFGQTTNTTDTPDTTTPSDNPTDDGDDGLRDSTIFDGLKVRDNDPDGPPDTPPDRPTRPAIDTPEPDPRPLPEPETPVVDRAAEKQLQQLEKLLINLSQFTRTEYEPAIRQQSASGMKNQLGKLPAVMQAIDQAKPELAERIRAVIDRYADPQIDGPAIRAEIKAIRKQLAGLLGGV